MMDIMVPETCWASHKFVVISTRTSESRTSDTIFSAERLFGRFQGHVTADNENLAQFSTHFVGAQNTSNDAIGHTSWRMSFTVLTVVCAVAVEWGKPPGQPRGYVLTSPPVTECQNKGAMWIGISEYFNSLSVYLYRYATSHTAVHKVCKAFAIT